MSRINKICFGRSFLLSYKRLKQENLNINFLLFKLLRQNEVDLDFKIIPLQVIKIVIVTCVKSCDGNIPFRCSFHVIYSFFLMWSLSSRQNARCSGHKYKLGSIGPCPLGPTVYWGIWAGKQLQFTYHMKAMQIHRKGTWPGLPKVGYGQGGKLSRSSLFFTTYIPNKSYTLTLGLHS